MESLVVKQVSSEEELQSALEVRKEVFVKEQGVSINIEVDEYDYLLNKDVIHFLLLDNHKVIGTLRIIDKEEYLKIGRVAILKDYRKKGFGKYFLEQVMKIVEDNNLLNISNKYFNLESQVRAIKFYNKLGFLEYGEEFEEAGIQHRKMKK